MTRNEEVLLLQELLALKKAGTPYLDDEATENPVGHYTDPTRFGDEQRAIFERSPQLLAHVSELPKPHSFLRRTVHGRPLLLTRGQDGDIRVFLNVCRHRGTRLVTAQVGCKRRHSCPYHAWTWDSDGNFVNAPHFEQGFPDLPSKELQLQALPAQVHGGFVWLLPEGEAPLTEFLGGMETALAWAGTELLTAHQQSTQLRRCNWKLLVEGGLEAYHFRIAHRNTIAPLFHDNLSSYQCFGPHMRSVLPRVSLDQLAAQPPEDWRIREHANVLLNVFPSSSLLVQADHVIWISMTPLAVDLSEVRMTTLIPTATNRPSSYWDRNHELTVATLNEDFDLGESIQEGLSSGANAVMHFGRFEGALGRFNSIADEHLSRAGASTA